MKIETVVTFKDIEPSPAIEADIRRQAEHLERFHDRIITCRVVVSAPHRHHHKGRLYHIHIDLSVPGREIVVNREGGLDHAHEDVYVAIRDAFNAAQRQLEDYVRKQSGHRSKRHPVAERGQVVRLMTEDGYGFIETGDGREVYFSRESVNDAGWRTIEVGSNVRLKEADGDRGPYAISVTVLADE